MKGTSDTVLATSKDVSRYTSVIRQQLEKEKNVSANMMHCITEIGCIPDMGYTRSESGNGVRHI